MNDRRGPMPPWHPERPKNCPSPSHCGIYRFRRSLYCEDHASLTVLRFLLDALNLQGGK